MVLVIDIGNTNVVIGLFENDKLTFSGRISTEQRRTEDEYSVILRGVFAINDIMVERIEGIIMSSVVPPLTQVIQNALANFTSAPVMIVGPGLKTGFKIRIDNPAQLGTDMVCNVAGALVEYKPPMVIVDMGTATTMTVVDRSGDILGGAIAPGVRISLDALSAGTAQLPFIPLQDAAVVIGKNTVDCMKSGVIFGAASMVDGMLERITEELGEEPLFLATGGMSGKIAGHCKHKIIHNPDLLVQGLHALYKRNCKKSI